MKITPTLIVKNGQRSLKETLSALQAFDEVIVVDTGSTDESLSIAATFSNVRLSHHPFIGFGPTRNHATTLASHDWILALDVDERLSPALLDEIFNLSLDPNVVYELPFHNYFNNKWIRGCGWHPESHIRLYHRHTTCFSDDLVHEGIKTEGLCVKRLYNPIYHIPYGSLSDFLLKCDRYSSLFADQYRGRRRATPWTACTHSVWAFLRSYLLQRGCILGYEGLVISVYQAQVAFYKYIKLYQANKQDNKIGKTIKNNNRMERIASSCSRQDK